MNCWQTWVSLRRRAGRTRCRRNLGPSHAPVATARNPDGQRLRRPDALVFRPPETHCMPSQVGTRSTESTKAPVQGPKETRTDHDLRRLTCQGTRFQLPIAPWAHRLHLPPPLHVPMDIQHLMLWFPNTTPCLRAQRRRQSL